MNNKLIYNKLEMKMIKDYHDLYLKCGVLLLSDVFGHFRNNIFKNYGLCPSHYLSEAALSRHAMLNITKVQFKLIPDPDMYLFFEKSMRGGVSCTSKRYSKTNNKYLKSYDPKQESKHIIFLDTILYTYIVSIILQTRII